MLAELLEMQVLLTQAVAVVVLLVGELLQVALVVQEL
jgi:hypothetical protein